LAEAAAFLCVTCSRCWLALAAGVVP